MNNDQVNTFSGKSAERPHEPQDRWLWIIQELFIDILSRLGAGIIFFFLAGLILAEPVQLWLQAHYCNTDHNTCSGLYELIRNAAQPLTEKGSIPLLSDTGLPLFVDIAVFFLAFLAGLIFSRLDINTPDRLSVHRRAKCLWWDYLRDKDKDLGKWERIAKDFSRFWKIAWSYLVLMKLFDDRPQEEEIQRLFISKLMCTCKADCEYPYHYLKQYLETRGYYGLAEMVPWNTPSSPKEVRKNFKRSRDFITLLKIRNCYYQRDAQMRHAHTEAIIRLLSSVWWAARIITWGSILSLVVFVFHYYNCHDLSLLSSILQSILHIPPLSMLAFAIAFFLRWGITNQFHDLRMREVLQVLAVAYTMRHDHPHWFDDIPAFDAQDGQYGQFGINLP
ncbi:MAG: hypothetical protein ACXV8Q_04855 [Methylobacter sp.]